MQQVPPDFFDVIIYVITFGLPATLLLTLFGLIVGLVFGTLLALARVYGSRPLQVFADIYVKTLQGIPLLVLLVLFGIGLSFLFTWAGPGLSGMFAAAVFCLGIRSAAYQSQIFRGAIESIDPGQLLAAKAVGMNNFQARRHIILPQAFRLSLPAWSNEYAVVIKDTSLAIALGIPEMMKVSFDIVANIPAVFFVVMIAVTVIYFCFTYPVTHFLGEYMTKRLRDLGLGGGKF
ncbi:MAG: amino acid ABC transporter permease [Candidatus Thorarchaeota archaeon]